MSGPDERCHWTVQSRQSATRPVYVKQLSVSSFENLLFSKLSSIVKHELIGQACAGSTGSVVVANRDVKTKTPGSTAS